MIDFGWLQEDPGDIIINNSGGPDCAIVFYGAAKYVKDNNLPVKFYHTTIDSKKKFFYIHHAKEIIKFVDETLGIPCEAHYTKAKVHVGKNRRTGMPTNYRETQRELIQDTYHKHKNIKHLITGSSNMLPKSFLLEEQSKGNWLDAELSPDTTRDETTTNLVLKSNSKGKKFEPLVNSDKRFVKELYDYYGVTDTLFPLTRSCESPSNSIYYKGQEHCGKCLFCFERYATFGKL